MSPSQTDRKINIAIDGYAACGKSSTARMVAHRLNYVYIDSGAMYRAFTLYLLDQGIDPADFDSVKAALTQAQIELLPLREDLSLEVRLNGVDVSRAIRSAPVNALVSEVSSLRSVRTHLVSLQRAIGADKGVVMDGRDIGTVVFPHAELKIFMTAHIDVRVRRRRLELELANMEVDEAEIRQNLEKRDWQDTHRAEGPLRRASDARLLDTTLLDFDDQVNLILDWVAEIVQSELRKA
jgi:cytidylate kinase